MKRLFVSLCLSMTVFGVLGPSSAKASDIKTSTNIFAPFFGEWALKNDEFQQVWDGKTIETLSIPGHYTNCQPVNTEQSVMCVVDAGGFQGHIFWAYDSLNNKLHHLSHFGTQRLGTGEGIVSETGNLRNKISFKDEPEGTYRIYEYNWVTADEYTMMSRQYDSDGAGTGNWYGGSFVRLEPVK